MMLQTTTRRSIKGGDKHGKEGQGQRKLKGQEEGLQEGEVTSKWTVCLLELRASHARQRITRGVARRATSPLNRRNMFRVTLTRPVTGQKGFV